MPAHTSTRLISSLKYLPPSAGVMAIAVGCLVLAGWRFDVPALKSLQPGLVAMNPSTAVAFILLGSSLWLLHNVRRVAWANRIGLACAGAAALMGLSKFSDALLGSTLQIDQLLFRERLVAVGSLQPNRMAPNTALNFLLLGLALLTLDTRTRRGHRPSQVLNVVSLLLSLMAVLGYLFDARSFYGVASYIPMALNTALTFCALGVGILFARTGHGLPLVLTREDPGGTMARRLLPFTIGVLAMLGWLRLQGERAGLYDHEFGASLLVFAGIVLLSGIILVNANSLSRTDAERRRAADGLRKAHDEMEGRVLERTAELSRANEDLKREMLERKEAEEALGRSEQQLRQAQKMEVVGRLAGGVAHDFNNLLTAIMGYSELVRARLRADDPARLDVEEIEKAGERAAALTRQLLAFSRQQVLQPRVLDLNDAIADLDKMLRRLIGSDIDILTVPAAVLRRVKADPGQIQQVILNLAVNARDAMSAGGKLTIETANVDIDEAYARERVEVRPGPYVMLAVSDNGCGMDSATRARIFEPFFTTKELGKGTGLGLSTVHGIVKQSGGHIEVYSEPGRGTTFKVYLPRVDEDHESVKSPSRPAGSVRGTETVLLVEDEAQVRGVIRETLARNGYTVIEARDGVEALDVCEGNRRGSVDLILTDLMMPNLGGTHLVNRLSQLRPNTKVLYMSGYRDKAVFHQGVLDENVAFLQKPFTPEGLLRKVREALDGPLRAAIATGRT